MCSGEQEPYETDLSADERDTRRCELGHAPGFKRAKRATGGEGCGCVQEEVSIQNSQGLDSLAALDPEAEYKSRLANSFSVHFRKVAENASRSVFLNLHGTGARDDRLYVAVQKSKHRTPAEEASA
jgi:hypothetical protein